MKNIMGLWASWNPGFLKRLLATQWAKQNVCIWEGLDGERSKKSIHFFFFLCVTWRLEVVVKKKTFATSPRSTLTCGRCTGKAGGWPAGEPRWWSPAGRRAGRRGGGVGKGVQRSGHTEWGRSRGPGSVGASPGKWPRRRPGGGPGASSRGTPGSTTSHPGSADRHWSKGWCGGPSLSLFLSLSSSLSLSPHLARSIHTHIHSLNKLTQICSTDYINRNK